MLKHKESIEQNTDSKAKNPEAGHQLREDQLAQNNKTYMFVARDHKEIRALGMTFDARYPCKVEGDQSKLCLFARLEINFKDNLDNVTIKINPIKDKDGKALTQERTFIASASRGPNNPKGGEMIQLPPNAVLGYLANKAEKFSITISGKQQGSDKMVTETLTFNFALTQKAPVPAPKGQKV